MSWHFSQALVAEYLAATSSDGAPFALSNGKPIPQAYCSPDRMTACSRLSRFGMTFAPLTDDHGAELLTWYQAAFHARTSAWPAKAQASTALEAASGAKWRESSVKYDPATSSWKTHLCLWEEVLPWSSVTLPRWGMTVNGVVYQHPTQERPISGTGSGLWPTPTCQDNIQEAGQFTSKTGTTLGYAARFWPTPTVQDSEQAGGLGCIERGKRGLSLHQATQLFPTPLSRDSKDGTLSAKAKAKRNAHPRGKPLNEQIGGQLNPTWVEWLMGWPLGWTDLKPLETDKFLEWQQQHSGF